MCWICYIVYVSLLKYENKESANIDIFLNLKFPNHSKQLHLFQQKMNDAKIVQNQKKTTNDLKVWERTKKSTEERNRSVKCVKGKWPYQHFLSKVFTVFSHSSSIQFFLHILFFAFATDEI